MPMICPVPHGRPAETTVGPYVRHTYTASPDASLIGNFDGIQHAAKDSLITTAPVEVRRLRERKSKEELEIMKCVNEVSPDDESDNQAFLTCSTPGNSVSYSSRPQRDVHRHA